MGFDLMYGSMLLLFSIASYKIVRSTPAQHWPLKLFKTLPVIIMFFLGAWLVGLWALPRGSKWHEVLRVPRHLWVLDHNTILDGVQKQRLTYGDDPRQYYYYYPALKNSTHPEQVIVFWHGGAWTTGHPDQHHYLAHLLQQQGYSLIFPAYRLTPKHHFEDLQEDVNLALMHSLQHLADQGLHTPKLILGGTSAGGNLATLLAYDEQRWKRLGLDRQALLQGVFSIAGALDLDAMESTIALRQYAGGAGDPSFALANPKTWVNAQDQFPFLCLHGDKDGLVAYTAARSFCDAIRLFCPDCVQFQTFSNMTHLQVTAMWYYRPTTQCGQGRTLVQWLNQLDTCAPQR